MKLKYLLRFMPFLLVLIGIGCSSEIPAKLREDRKRDELQAKKLFDDSYIPDAPVNNEYFTAIGESGEPLHSFEGRLSVGEFEMEDTIPSGEVRSESGRYFPGFSTDFFTFEDYLVPADREILAPVGERSRWRLILSPGKVWSEPKDDGYSRAAFPLALVSESNNETHNGLATFLFNDDEVSQLYFQITQETAAWNRNDYWGQTRAEYQPGPLADGERLRSQFAEELASQLDIRALSDLQALATEEMLEVFTGGLESEDISATGLILDEAIYLQPLATRYGEMPYDRFVRHGVFSVTKSMGALVAMLRLAEKYGDEVFDLKVADYVDITARHDGWQDVTFGDALSMASGVGDSGINPTGSYFTADEDQDKFSRWLDALSKDEKLEIAFSYNNYPWGPGTVARYNSINTFILSAAMDAFLKEQEGPEADIWHMVEEEVYKPIGVFHSPIMRTIEPDGSPGLPILAYGLYPTIEDTAKITGLLQNEGRHDGEQLLSPTKLAEALYQTDMQGLTINQPNQYGESRYLHSFWSAAYCEDSGYCYQVPYMVGYGGNLVALLPNDVTAFRYADAHIYDPLPLIDLATAVQ